MSAHKVISRILLVMISAVLISCGGSTTETKKVLSAGELSKIEVSIAGMTCTGCEQTIMKSVGKLEGIDSVSASYKEGKAIIKYSPSLTDTLKIRDAITSSGYTVSRFSRIE